MKKTNLFAWMAMAMAAASLTVGCVITTSDNSGDNNTGSSSGEAGSSSGEAGSSSGEAGSSSGEAGSSSGEAGSSSGEAAQAPEFSDESIQGQATVTVGEENEYTISFKYSSAVGLPAEATFVAGLADYPDALNEDQDAVAAAITTYSFAKSADSTVNAGSVSGTLKFKAPVEGNYGIVIQVTDSAGKVGESATFPITAEAASTGE